MSDEQKILDRILADANMEAEAVIARAKAEADELLAAAKAKADKEMEVLAKAAENEAAKAAAKAISGAQMQARKNILAAKQALLEDAIAAARDKLLHLSRAEYTKTILDMIQAANIRQGQVLLSAKDKADLGQVLQDAGVNVGEETRDIAGGFVVKDGDVEYNYSFASILAIQREEMEYTAANVLFG